MGAETPGRPRTDDADAEERTEECLGNVASLFSFQTFCVSGLNFGLGAKLNEEAKPANARQQTQNS